jgi:hypothetical protein
VERFKNGIKEFALHFLFNLIDIFAALHGSEMINK